MMHHPGYRSTARTTATALLAVALLCAAAPAAAHTLKVDALLAESWEPGVDFVSIKTTVHRDGSPEREQSLSAFTTDDFHTRPVEVAWFGQLPSGTYSVRSMLKNETGAVVAETESRFSLQANRVVQMRFPTPRPLHLKTLQFYDKDRDGQISPADEVEYTIILRAPQDSHFVDEVEPSLRILPGTVTSTGGSIVQGNQIGADRILVVDLDGSTAVRFDAALRPRVSSQGRLELTFGSFFGTVPTDDPYTPEADDETVLEVGCNIGNCGLELSQCRDELAPCTAGLADCQTAFDTCDLERNALRAEADDLLAATDALIGDGDGDGVINALDLCPNTRATASTVVDLRGCTQAEFCGRVDMTQPQASAVCRAADWLGDEPLSTSPDDCRPGGFGCSSR